MANKGNNRNINAKKFKATQYPKNNYHNSKNTRNYNNYEKKNDNNRNTINANLFGIHLDVDVDTVIENVEKAQKRKQARENNDN